MSINELLGRELFPIGETIVTVSSLGSAILIALGGFALAQIVDRTIGRAIDKRGGNSIGELSSIRRLIRYTIDIVFVLVAINALGIDLSALFTAGAIFAVGIGFAMQNIVQNFVSGVILLAERKLTIGDVITLNGMLLRIESLGIRSTVARKNDGAQIIIPNSHLVQNNVENHSMSDSMRRYTCRVGVAYESEMPKVRATLEALGRRLNDKKASHDPLVLLHEFADSSVTWELHLWTCDPMNTQVYRSKAMESLFTAFKEQEIEIAYPQLDVHFGDQPLSLVKNDNLVSKTSAAAR